MKDFKPHMMYDPKTGKAYKAEKPEDHERMQKLGYVHESHFGYKKGTHAVMKQQWPLRVGTQGNPNAPEELIKKCFKDPMVKKYFKVASKPKPESGVDANYLNSYVYMAPKQGHLYKLFVGTGQFEYWALAIKPGEVYIFRQRDLSYNRMEYIEWEKSMSGPNKSYDFAEFKEQVTYKGNQNPQKTSSHFVKVGWGIEDIGLEYTQLQLPFNEAASYPSFEADKNIRYKDTVVAKGYWTYTGKESGGKGVYLNTSNQQRLGFDKDDLSYFKKHLPDHFKIY